MSDLARGIKNVERWAMLGIWQERQCAGNADIQDLR